MHLGRRQRKLLKALGLVAAGLLAIWLGVPLWFPWVLRPLARSQGLSYSHFEREGYSRFVLHDLRLTNGATRIHIERAEALTPNVWLWRSQVAEAKRAGPFVGVTHWEFESLASAAKAGSGTADSVEAVFQQVAKIFKALNRWLPTAVLLDGTIRVGETRLAVPTLTWLGGTLRAEVAMPSQAQSVALEAHLGQGAPYHIEMRSDSLHLQSYIQVSTNADGVELQSTNYWWNNRVEVQARFARSGVLPATARLRAEKFVLPTAWGQLSQYQEPEGAVTATWDHGRFALELSAGASPVANQTNLPPLRLGLRAQGDTNAVVVESADLSAGWLKAELSRELKVHFTGPLLSEPARLQVAADLSRQPWFEAQGVLKGEAEFSPSGMKLPSVNFRLSGSNVGQQALQAESLLLAGSLDWPWLEIRQVDARFTDDSIASVVGKMDLEQKRLANGKIRLSGPLVRRWLPPGYSYEGLALSADFEGLLAEIKHNGQLEVTNATVPFARPLQIRAGWSGTQTKFQSVHVVASAGNSSILAGGSLAAEKSALTVELSALSLLTNHQPALELAQPFQLMANWGEPDMEWRVHTGPLNLVGSSGHLSAQASFQWPKEGAMRLSAQGLSSTLLAGFARTNLPELEVRTLNTAVHWTNGPASFDLELAAAGRAPRSADEPSDKAQLISGAIELKLNGDAKGIALSNLVVTSEGAAATAAKGFLPLTLHPADQTNLVHLETNQPMWLTATTEPKAFFWNTLAEWTGITLREPDLKANVSGTWQNAEGEVRLEARAIRLERATGKLPALEDLRIVLKMDRQRAHLVEGQLLVQGQAVNLTGELPLGENFWAEIREKRVPDWGQGSLRLRITEAELAPFEPLFPTLLTPQGALNADVRLLPGGNLEGYMNLQHARTRPLAGIGPIRDINVQLQFHERALKLVSATAQVGGAPLEIHGQADLQGTGWLHGAMPPFQITLYGTNVPLAREPETVMRSDLRLTITRTNGAPPLISGVARLRDSHYLSDLSALIPGKVARVNQRPPYFSIDDPALAAWRVAVDAQGERFLKIRSSLLIGVISANLKLRGTLKDPIALGDLNINSGVVRFPFVSLEIQQGLVTLTSQDPYRPQLTLSAASKQYGYDIRLQVSGTVDEPIIQFSSTPPLSSEQILLMATAGEMPQGSFALTPQQRAQTAAMFLGQDLLAKLGFGDQSKQRLIIRSGQEVSDTGRPTYDVEYKLTDRWSVIGEYDRFGDYNAGVKWRIYSK